jgi:hypothetical protein
MRQIFKNLYIETYRNFDRDIDNELSNLTKYNIKYVVNLTECDVLNACHRISLLCNKIKSKDLFDNPDLLRIKKIPPQNRSRHDISLRYILRENIINEEKNYILDLSKETENILFLCNKNNVLSQLFVFILMTLQGEEDHIPILIKDRNIVTSVKNETDIKKYLDKYIDIIYNNINEVSEQKMQRESV